MESKGTTTTTLAALIAALATVAACSSVQEAVEDGEISTEDVEKAADESGSSGGTGASAEAQSATGTDGASSSGGSASSSADGDTDPTSTPKAIRQAYEEMTFEDCLRPGSCLQPFLKMAGLDQPSYGEPSMTNPRRVMENPDPKWLPGWEKLDTDKRTMDAEEAAEALALAAVRKSWRDRCYSDFDKLHRAISSLGDKVDASIKKARNKETVYGRLATILKARRHFQSEKFPKIVRYTGPRVELEATIKKAFADANREFLYWNQDLNPESDELRPLLSSKEAERELYCWRALSYDGRWKTPEIPWTDPTDEEVAAAVRPVIDQELASRAHDKAESLMAKTAERFSRADVEVDGLQSAKGDNADRDTPLWFDNDDGDYELKSVEHSGDEAVLKFYHEYEDSHVIRGSCKETDKVDKVYPDGTVKYRTVCKHKHFTNEMHVRVTVPKDQLPEGTTFKAGDTVGLYGRFVSRDFRTISESPKRNRYDIELELWHLRWNKRGGETVFGPYF